jgi:predicted homoserine dehydrogenase-like protein
VTVAKRNLKAGERLDGIGGFCSYGLIDNTSSARAMEALPIALSEDCVLRRNIAKDDVLSFNDVDQPSGRLVDSLWSEQCERWPQVSKGSRAPSTQHVTKPDFMPSSSWPRNGNA